VAALGAGLALGHRADADDETPVDSGMKAGRLDDLRDAVTSLLTDPSYRAAAGAVAAEIAAQPPVDAVVDVLEDVVRGEALAA
jgi:hypothetical protein